MDIYFSAGHYIFFKNWNDSSSGNFIELLSIQELNEEIEELQEKLRNLVAYGCTGCILRAFNNQLIVDMADDEEPGKGAHGITEDIPANCLDDVLNKFRTVRFDAFSFLCGSDSHVGNGLSSERVLPDPWFNIGQGPSGWKPDEQHPASVGKMDVTNSGRNPFFDHLFNGAVHAPPVLHDAGVCIPPGCDKRLEFFFCHPHFYRPH